MFIMNGFLLYKFAYKFETLFNAFVLNITLFLWR
jgi:hypothetical protein